MPLSATYDQEANALYVRVRDGERARTIEVDESHYVDVDEHGAPLGIEVLYPAMGSRIGEILERFGLAGHLEEISRAVTDAIADAGGVTATYAGNASHAYAIVGDIGQPVGTGVTGWPSTTGNAVPQIPEPA